MLQGSHEPSPSCAVGHGQKRQRQESRRRRPARQCGGIAASDSSARSLCDSDSSSETGDKVPVEVDGSQPDEGEGEGEEQEQEEDDEGGQTRPFAGAGYVSSTISCSPVSLSPFSARIRSCTYTSFPCRFNAAERKALAIAKKESRRDNTTKSYASHQERFKVQRSALTCANVCHVPSQVLCIDFFVRLYPTPLCWCSVCNTTPLQW